MKRAKENAQEREHKKYTGKTGKCFELDQHFLITGNKWFNQFMKRLPNSSLW